MRRVIFEGRVFEDFTDWANQDKRIYVKIVELIRDIQRSPFTGLGKPEPLNMIWLAIGRDESTTSTGWSTR